MKTRTPREESACAAWSAEPCVSCPSESSQTRSTCSGGKSVSAKPSALPMSVEGTSEVMRAKPALPRACAGGAREGRHLKRVDRSLRAKGLHTRMGRLKHLVRDRRRDVDKRHDGHLRCIFCVHGPRECDAEKRQEKHAQRRGEDKPRARQCCLRAIRKEHHEGNARKQKEHLRREEAPRGCAEERRIDGRPEARARGARRRRSRGRWAVRWRTAPSCRPPMKEEPLKREKRRTRVR